MVEDITYSPITGTIVSNKWCLLIPLLQYRITLRIKLRNSTNIFVRQIRWRKRYIASSHQSVMSLIASCLCINTPVTPPSIGLTTTCNRVMWFRWSSHRTTNHLPWRYAPVGYLAPMNLVLSKEPQLRNT